MADRRRVRNRNPAPSNPEPEEDETLFADGDAAEDSSWGDDSGFEPDADFEMGSPKVAIDPSRRRTETAQIEDPAAVPSARSSRRTRAAPDASDAKPSGRRRSKGGESDDSARSSRRSGRREREEGSATSGSGFFKRVFMGIIGAAIVLGIQAGPFHAQLKDALAGLAGDFAAAQVYGIAAGVLFGAALIIALIAAVQDRSAWRCWQIAAGWTAVAIFVVSLGRYTRPTTEPADANQAGLASAELLATPIMHFWLAERNALAEQAAAGEQAQASISELETQHASALAARDQQLAQRDEQLAERDRQITELRDEVTTTRQELDTATMNAERLNRDLSKVQRDLEQAEAIVTGQTADLEQLRAQLGELQAKIDELSAANYDASAAEPPIDIPAGNFPLEDETPPTE